MSRALTLLVVIVAICSSSGMAMVFELESVHPSLTNHTVHLARDKARHARLFRSRIGTTTTSSGPAVNFDVWTLMESFGPGPHYNVKLEGISINGQPLPINQAVFGNSHNRGAIVDSGSTFAYVPKEAYDPFVDAINTAVSQSVTLIISEGIQCYLVSTSVSDLFPHVSLNFAGGVSMELRAEEYLQLISLPVNPSTWCIAFQRSEDGLTILGDQVLKDKIVVYDLGRQRVGWANYNCSLPVNVLVTLGNGEPSFSSSKQHFLFQALVLQCLLLLVDQLIMVQF